MKNQKKRIVHAYADYDSAVGEIVLDKSRPGYRNIFDANPKLNQYIMDLCTDKTVEKVIIHCFSTRQDGFNDGRNGKMNGNGSAFEHMDYYVEALQLYSDKIHLETMLAEDLFLKEEAGWLWKNLRKNGWPQIRKNGRSDSYDPRLVGRQWLGDTSKIVLFFIHAWHSYFTRDPDFEHLIEVFDDREDIANNISKFYRLNPGLFPPGFSAEFTQYWHYVRATGVESRHDFFKREELTIVHEGEYLVEPFDVLSAVHALVDILQLDDDYKIKAKKIPANLTLDSLLSPAKEPVVVPEPISPVVVSTECDETEERPLIIDIEMDFEEPEEDEKTSELGCCTALYHLLYRYVAGRPAVNESEIMTVRAGYKTRVL